MDQDLTGELNCEVTADEADNLYSVIEQVSETEIHKISLVGRLVGLDVKTNYFHIETPDSVEIRGSLAEEFAASENWEINRYYRVEAARETRVKYATGEETESFQLVALYPEADQAA